MPRLSPPDETRRVALAEAIARAWNEYALSYAVVHGLEDYPARLGRDVDVLLRRQDVRPAVALAVETAREHGFETVLFRWSHWGLYQLAFLDPDASLALPLDLLCTARVWRAKWVRMVDKPLLDRLTAGDGQTGPFAVSNTGRFLKSLVRPLLCGDVSRIGPGLEWNPPVSVPPELDRRVLVGLLGERHFGELESGDGSDLFRPAVGPELQRRWIRLHPASAMRSFCDAAAGRLLRRGLDPAACLVVQATQSQLLPDALSTLATEARHLFIDVRLAVMPRSPLTRIAEAIAVWRAPSISEFAVTVVVDERPPARRSSGSAERTLRWPPSARVALPDELSTSEARETVRTCLLAFLADSYSPAHFLGDPRMSRLSTAQRGGGAR